MVDTSHNVTRFTQRASDYHLARPSYPDGAFDAVLDGFDASSVCIADIGAGTGRSAQPLVDRGATVIAVEPNEAMRAALVEDGRIEVRDGTAEFTGLDEACVDLIVCAQSYHWFDVDAACVEFARVLHPNGRLALLWNDHDDDSPVSSAYVRLVCEAGEIETLPHREIARRPSVVEPFAKTAAMTFPNMQLLALDGLLRRARSASYVPLSGPKWDQLEASLRELHEKHADGEGHVAFAYVTRLYLYERDAPACGPS